MRLLYCLYAAIFQYMKILHPKESDWEMAGHALMAMSFIYGIASMPIILVLRILYDISISPVVATVIYIVVTYTLYYLLMANKKWESLAVGYPIRPVSRLTAIVWIAISGLVALLVIMFSGRAIHYLLGTSPH